MHVICAWRWFVTLARLPALLAVLNLAFFQTSAANAEPAGIVSDYTAGSQVVVDHSTWDRLLKTHVKAGADGLNRVDYRAFQAAGQQDLKAYIARLEKTDLKVLDRPEQFALLANLYNAKTIDIVLDKYPVKSIKDISLGGGLIASIKGGPWKAKVLNVAGMPLSLDDIEHGILRPVFKDARVHYAVNCASVGCPNLQTQAFTGGQLNAQLDASARAFINHPRAVAVTADGVAVSSIYKWFKEDFGSSDAGVLKHLRTFANPELTAKLKSANSLDSYRYDWSLNDIVR